MRHIKAVLSLALVLCCIFGFSICSSAETNSVELDCGVTVSASLENKQLVVSVTNNSGKDINTIGIFHTQYNSEKEIENTSAEALLTSIANGETKELSVALYSPEEFNSITLYPCTIVYMDFSRWGASVDSIDAAKGLGYEFSVNNDTSVLPVNANSNNPSKSSILGISLFLVVIVVALIIFLKKSNNYKTSDYYAQTGMPFFKVFFNKGLYGEFITRSHLENIEGYKKFLSNVYLTKSNGQTTEADLIMIHTSGIFVFENKNYGGWIFGDENSQKWMQVLKHGEKHQFLNPIYQNNLHINTLKQTLNLSESVNFYSVVVFNDRSIFKELKVTSVPVIHSSDLHRTVSSIALQSPNNLSSEKVDELYSKLYPYTQVSEEVKQKHIQDIKSNRN